MEGLDFLYTTSDAHVIVSLVVHAISNRSLVERPQGLKIRSARVPR